MIRLSSLAFSLLLVSSLAASDFSARQLPLADVVSLPPVLEDLAGNAKIRRVDGDQISVTVRGRALAARRIREVRVAAPADARNPAIRTAIAEAVLEHFWRPHVARQVSPEFELIEIDRERFLEIGVGQLIGQPIDDEPGNAWWRVRMEMPLTPDPDHHLAVVISLWESGISYYGHIAFGLREAGGDVEHDVLFDPRAPWHVDEAPSVKAWLNFDKSLINGLQVSNLYDWLYTQTHFRASRIQITFLPATREHVTLISDLSRRFRDDPGDLGPFGSFHNNCASISRKYFAAMLPLNQKFGAWNPILDAPRKIGKQAIRKFGFVEVVELPGQTESNGREATFDSTILRPADRRSTPEFQQLLESEAIN